MSEFQDIEQLLLDIVTGQKPVTLLIDAYALVAQFIPGAVTEAGIIAKAAGDALGRFMAENLHRAPPGGWPVLTGQDEAAKHAGAVLAAAGEAGPRLEDE